VVVIWEDVGAVEMAEIEHGVGSEGGMWKGRLQNDQGMGDAR
jgi:hypothetical protein